MSGNRLRSALAVLILEMLLAGAAHAHPASGIAVDQRGRVFFVDALEGVFSIEGDGSTRLVNPSAMHWMALDSDGSFRNAPDEFGEWFGRLTPKGEKPTLLSCSDFPCVMGADGNVYFAKMHSLTIMRRSPAGEESVLVSPQDFGFEPDRPVGVNGMACGPDGTIYLVALDQLHQSEASEEHIVYAIDPEGRVRTFAKNFLSEKIPESERHYEARPEYCRGMAVDGDGNLYVAATGNRCVMKLTTDGKAETVLTSKRPWTPTGVDVFRGAVYVLEYDDETPAEGRSWPLRVRKLDREGKVTTLVTVRGRAAVEN